MRQLPTGTVTFLRTDIEGSMAHVRALTSDWDEVNAEHLGLIRGAVDVHGGVTVRTEGDALFAAFPEATSAALAAVEAQRALHDRDWPVADGLRVRMGLHSGEAHLAGDDYGGFEVNRAARVAAAGHGSQIVVSGTTRALIADALPDGIEIRDLGEHRLKDVPRPERLFQLEAAGLPTTFPPLRTGRATQGNLPTRLTSFVGRAAELAELEALLAATRLLTLTGPGGIGKTSLATELARDRADQYSDGAWFVALDGVTDAGLVTSVIARTIGLFDGPARSGAARLHAYAADRSMLFVLDNFEQVLDAAADVAALLAASPRSRVIVTSRAPLRIGGEQEYPVRPLEAGDSGPSGSDLEPAVQLFLDRARAVRPGWQPSADLAVVRGICEALDDLPLGIELAAARVAVMPLPAIRDRLAARLPLPGSGPRDAPIRQRTLDGAIRWSHDLLAPEHRSLLERASVFEGSFDAEQAAAVMGDPHRASGDDILDGLIALTEQSLAVTALDPRAEPMLGMATGMRWRLLRTIQAFGSSRLRDQGDDEAVRGLHARAYLALAEAAAPHLPGPDQPRWLDRLGLDHANLRAALRWAIDAGEAETALRLVASLWRYWQLDGHLHEGRSHAEATLGMTVDDAPPQVRLAAITAAGNIAYWQADAAAARRRYKEQIALARSLGDPRAEADGIFNLGHVDYIDTGDPDSIASFLAEAEDRFRVLGDERAVWRAAWGRGTMFLSQGRLTEAEELSRACLVQFEANGDTQYRAMAISSLGWIAFMQGDVAKAARYSAEGLAESYRSRDVATTTLSLQEGMLLAAATGMAEEAAILQGAFEAMCERHGVRPPASLQRFLDSWSPEDAIRSLLDGPALEAAFARGRGLSLDEAVAFMLEVEERVAAGRQNAP